MSEDGYEDGAGKRRFESHTSLLLQTIRNVVMILFEVQIILAGSLI
jgi:hypothetical protein